MSVLLGETDEGVDGLRVLRVLLSLDDDLLEAGDEVVFGFVGGGEFLVKVL